LAGPFYFARRSFLVFTEYNPGVKEAQRPVPLLSARWPTREEAERSRWFAPLKLGRTTALARTWVPAMVPWRATEDGFVTEDVLDWYGRFAEGRPGVLVVEATGIRDVPSGPLLRIGHDRFLPGLERLVERVRERSGGETRLFIQVIDFLQIRRRPEKAKYFERFLAITDGHRRELERRTGDARFRDGPESEVRAALSALDDDALRELLTEREHEAYAFGFRERVTDVEKPHVAELPRVLPGLFADAAERAKRAGFDGVELHYAHAYTMASFLSARNTRTDGYGGPRENRVRLPLEVYRAVRARVGDFTTGVRFLGDEVIESGNRIEDAVYFGVEFARAGFDFLSISKGGKFEDAKQPKIGWAAYPYTGPSGHECMPTVRIDARGPFGRNVPLATAIKRAVNAAGLATPVIASGGICTFEQAEAILASGEADAVASARQTLADPDWFAKIRLGRGAEVRRCEFTNYCEGLDQQHKQVTCKLWDRKFSPGEPGVTLSADGKRRLVAPPWRPSS
jgi:2,4-dienoyl-CoA reductase-like NADH-dependent reductase (Old Yellow Enzyme family)